jgi:hypothetical protein
MAGIEEWAGQHKAVAIGGAIVLFGGFWLLMRPSAAQSAGAAVQYVQSGPSDAVQEAQIAASANVSATNAAAYSAAQQTQAQYATAVAQLTAQNYQTGIAGNVAEYQAATSLTGTEAGVQGQVDLADYASQVAEAQTAGQVTIAQTADQTQADINQQNQQTQQLQISSQARSYQAQLEADQAENLQNTTLQARLADTAASVVNDQTASTTAIQLAGINTAGTVSLANIGANRDISLANTAGAVQVAGEGIAATATNNAEEIAATQAIEEGQTAYHTGLADSVINLIQSGAINKGAEGGTNQASVLNGLITGNAAAPPTVGVSTTSGIISSLGNSIANIASGLFGGHLNIGGGSTNTSAPVPTVSSTFTPETVV